MATKIGQELVEFSFNQAETKLSDGTLGFDSKNLDIFTKKVEAYERELKRVFGSLVTTVSQIDQVTGQAVSKMYLPKRYEAEALGVRRAVDLQEFGKQGMNSTQAKNLMYQGTSDAVFLETTSRIKGAKAQQFAKEAVIDAGGRIIHTPNKADKDMMTTFIPISDAQLSSMGSKDINDFVSRVMPNANTASRAEQRERTKKEKEAEREAQMERDAQRQRQHLKEVKSQNEAQRRADERKKSEEAKAQAQEEKDKIASRKHMLGTVGKIVGLTIMLVNIARRILTSILNFGSAYNKSATQAGTLNTGAQDLRNLNFLDRALGLDEGTQVQGQEDLRSQFGNTANLNTQSLKWLAMVMGNKVGQMVQSGLGGENPAYLMEQIIDDFYKRQQEGKDQYGNYVGQDKARRALVTLLESVSPAIARTFERMVEEQTTGLHAGEITSYRQLQMIYNPNTGNLSSLDWEKVKLLGEEADSVRAKFAELGKLIEGNVMIALSGFVAKMNNLKIGERADESLDKDLSDEDYLVSRYELVKTQQAEAKSKLDKFAKSQGFASYEEMVSANKDTWFADWGGVTPESVSLHNKAREAMYKLMNTYTYNEALLSYYGLGEAMADIESDLKKGKRADRVKYSDTGLAKYTSNGIHSSDLPVLSSMYGMEFQPSDFIDVLTDYGKTGSVQEVIKMNRLATSFWTYEGFAPEKRAYVGAGAEEFFKRAFSADGNTKWGKYLKEALKDKKLAKFLSDTYGIDVSGTDWEKIYNMAVNSGASFENTPSGQMLLQLYSAMLSDPSMTKLKKGEVADIRSLAKYLPDEYGLTMLEKEDIAEQVRLGKLRFSGYNKIYSEAGDTAGTVNIRFVQEVNGKETQVGVLQAKASQDRDTQYVIEMTEIDTANETSAR